MKIGCRTTVSGFLRQITIFIILLLLIVTGLSAQSISQPEREFSTEVLLNKQGVGYDLSKFEPHIEAGTVNYNDIGYYIYRSHYNPDLGVVIYEVTEVGMDLDGLSISLVIPTEWVENPEDDTGNTSESSMVLMSSVDIDPESLDWNQAIYTELTWLVDQSILTGLTEEDLDDIRLEVGSGYSGWDHRIVYEDGDWIPYNKTLSPLEAFFGLYQLDKNILPDTVPYPILGQDEPMHEVKEEDKNYELFILAGALIVIVILGAFSYSRLKRRSVLDNLNRKNIFEHIKSHPGVHFNELLRELDMQPGSMSYHLNVLEKKEFVKSIQDGNYRRFFLYGSKTDFKIALTSIQLRIISIVDKKPGITQVKISKSIGKNRMLVNYHIKILRDAGILNIERSGRETLCYTTSAAMVYLA
jgi:DNA-binding transcriptional ArsR family regulator